MKKSARRIVSLALVLLMALSATAMGQVIYSKPFSLKNKKIHTRKQEVAVTQVKAKGLEADGALADLLPAPTLLESEDPADTPAPSGAPAGDNTPAPSGDPAGDNTPAPSGDPAGDNTPAPSGDPGDITPAPSGDPAGDITPAPSGDPADTPAPSGDPAEDVTPEPTFVSLYQRDEAGELVLDQDGNPIPLQPFPYPVIYRRDEAGKLMLDANGEPIADKVVPDPTEDPAPSDDPDGEVTPAPSGDPDGEITPAPSDDPSGDVTPAPSDTPKPTKKPTPAPVDTPTPTPEPEVTPVPDVTPEPAKGQGKITTDTEAGSLNVRPAPGIDGEPVGKVPNGAVVTILGQSEDGSWTQIEYVNESGETVTGYVFSAYLTVQPDEQPTEEPEEPVKPEDVQILVDEEGNEYILDDGGNRVDVLTAEDGSKYYLDGEGNPVVLVQPEEPVKPEDVQILVDEEGNEYILDDGGNRIDVLTAEDGAKYYLDGEGNPVVLIPAPEADQNLYIAASIPTDVALGDTITMTCVVEGYDDVPYTLQWQKMDTDRQGHYIGQWTDVPGATGPDYSLTLTRQSVLSAWRVMLITADQAA